MEDLHRERIINNLTTLAEKTHWNCVLEEKLLFYKIFNTKMIEDITKVGITLCINCLRMDHLNVNGY